MASLDRRVRAPFLALLVLAPAGLAQEPMTELARRSGLTFVGTVKATGKATEGVVLEPGSAIVRVEQVLEALPPLGNPTGQDVTVRLLDPAKARAGDRAVFFTYIQTAGRTLGLVEVTSRPAGDADAVKRGLAEARRAIEDEALLKRLAAAELVALGTIGPGEPAEAPQDVDEHDPLWWTAPLRGEAVLKGRAPAGPVPVNYATNVDFRWAESPKPQAGQSGLFLLHVAREPRVQGLFLIDKLDLLPKSDAERVRTLLARLH